MKYNINLQNDEIEKFFASNIDNFHAVQKGQFDKNVMGWFDVEMYASQSHIDEIEKLALKIKEKADVFLLCGVGGSNRGAQSVIEYFREKSNIEIRYIGNNLSARYLQKTLKGLDGKRVYANVIAKDFRTLEPGICFRMLRKFFKERGENPAEKIVLTGSVGTSFEQIAKNYGYDFLEFPKEMGGRYSVLSAVGLFPMAVMGIDINKVVQGAKKMKNIVTSTDIKSNISAKYVACRQILSKKGFGVENLCYFEPELDYFARWWLQLFGESEGKFDGAILPYTCNFSEDLHAIGQYIQEGKKNIFETFLQGISSADFVIEKDDFFTNPADGFEYLDGKNFSILNNAVFHGSKKAHEDAGIPVGTLDFGNLTEEIFGELFYFFMFSCYFSCMASNVNPFDQNGVEDYKKNMYSILK